MPKKKKKEREITEKEKLVVEYYFEQGCKNMSLAAKKAGYAPQTAVKNAPNWIKTNRIDSERPQMYNYLQTLRKEQQKKIGINSKRIIKRLIREIELDPKEIFNEDGTVRNIQDIPIGIRKLLDIKVIKNTSRPKGKKADFVRHQHLTVQIPNKQKSIEMLAKMLGLFSETNITINNKKIQNNAINVNVSGMTEEQLAEYIRKSLQGTRAENSKKLA